MTLQQEERQKAPAAAEPGPEPGFPPRAEVKTAFGYCFKVWLSVRVGLFMAGLVGVALLPANSVADVPTWPAPALTPGWHNLFTAWERWDALWYLRIAAHGYSPTDTSAAFFPVYPLLVRVFSFLTGGHPLAGAFIVANVAALLAFVVVYLLTRHELDDRRARQTVLFMAVFPTSYFFFAPYSESVFLLFAATSLFSARLGKWWLAAVAGALAAATRSIGITLALPLALEAIHQARAAPRGERNPVRVAYTLACSGAVGLGLAAYLAYWKVTAHDWLLPFSSQNGWLREFSWPWETVVNGTKAGLQFIGSYPGGYHTLDLIIVAFVLVALIWVVLKWVAMKIPAVYASYAIVSFLMPLFLVFGGRPFMSLSRFILVIWPLFWAMGAFADRFKARDLIVGLSAAGLGIMAILFVNWFYVF